MSRYKENKINWKLLAKYLSGESDNEEGFRVNEWINSNNKNKILFKNIQTDWEKINSIKNMKKVDVDSAWENVKQRILKSEPELIPLTELTRVNTAKLFLYRSLRIAASVLLVMGISFGIYKVYVKSYFDNNTIIKSGADNTSRLILPDGSQVYLNSGTFIRYSNNFGSGSRQVYLKGEAYFDVVRNKSHPFTVTTNDAVVKVLGTSFNINTRTSNNKIEVFVESGNVQLSQKNNHDNNILIEPGYIGTLSGEKLIKSENKDINYLSWKTKYLIFRETGMEKVAEKLESVYNTSIKFSSQEMANCKLTATFNNASLDSVLMVIEGSFNLQIENIIKTKEKVIIVGSGC
jgi:transmembrane sensor